jgi:hypothetical protein
MDTTHINMERRTVFNLALFAIGNSVCLLGCCCCSHLTPLGLIESGRTGERERDRERETERERERERRGERERETERERERRLAKRQQEIGMRLAFHSGLAALWPGQINS